MKNNLFVAIWEAYQPLASRWWPMRWWFVFSDERPMAFLSRKILVCFCSRVIWLDFGLCCVTWCPWWNKFLVLSFFRLSCKLCCMHGFEAINEYLMLHGLVCKLLGHNYYLIKLATCALRLHHFAFARSNLWGDKGQNAIGLILSSKHSTMSHWRPFLKICFSRNYYVCTCGIQLVKD